MKRFYLFDAIALNNSDGLTQLRTVTTGDHLLISNYFLHNQTHLAPWEAIRDNSLSAWQKRVQQLMILHHKSLACYCLIIDEKSGEMLGMISFSQITRFPSHSCCVGYSLDQRYVGKGIMSRALKIACDYMFEVQNLRRITAYYLPHNQRSERLLQRLGFEYEGIVKSFLLMNGQWQDHIRVSLLNEQWTSQK